MSVRVLGYYNLMRAGHDVAILVDDQMVSAVTFEPHQPGALMPPLFVGAKGTEFLRAALNAAWELGMRPDGYEDTRESMRATDARLQDMRAIAFHKLGTTPPQRR